MIDGRDWGVERVDQGGWWRMGGRGRAGAGGKKKVEGSSSGNRVAASARLKTAKSKLYRPNHT